MKTNSKIFMLLFAGIVVISFAGILVRVITISPLVTAFYRVLISVLLLTPIFVLKFRDRYFYFFNYRFMLVGFFLAVHLFLWIAAFEYTSVANAVIFVAIQPLFTIFLEYFLAREDFKKAVIPGIMLALIGSLIISSGDINILFSRLWGNLLALGAAFFAACYLFSGRSLRRQIEYFPYIYIVYTYAAFFLGLIVLIAGKPVTGFSGQNYMYLMALALGPTLIGHSVVNFSLRKIPTTFVAVSLLGEPILTTLMAWVLLGEAATLTTIIGGSLIIWGIFRVVVNSRG
ncbi:MAG: DMT family transporter [Bacillota bacterium]